MNRPAGVVNTDGYRRIRHLGKMYAAHRVAVLLVTGDWPEHQVDHINGQRGDNRWENIRCVAERENHKNKATPCHNTSGRIGVYWIKASKRWRASIKSNGVLYPLGEHAQMADAIAAREQAERDHNFHPNHGRTV
jgi:hypothetical protein